MRYHIVHELPGRLRIHCHGLRKVDASGLRVDRWADSTPWITAASLSPRTGNIVITYRRDLPRQAVLDFLAGENLLAVVTVGKTETACQPSLTNALLRTGRKHVVSMAVKPFLPRFLQPVVGLFHCAKHLCMIQRHHAAGNSQGVLFSIFKLLMFFLRGHAVIIKVAFLITGAVLDHQLLRQPAGELPPDPEMGIRDILEVPVEVVESLPA